MRWEFYGLLGWCFLTFGGWRSTLASMASLGLPPAGTDAAWLSIAAAPKQSFPVDLVGVRYQVTPPKAAFGMALAMRAKNAAEDPEALQQALESLCIKMFGKKDAVKVLARLEDEEDDLDIDHIMRLMQALVEVSTTAEVPTT